MTDDLFEQFWLAGMRKCNKKKAKPLFNRLLKASDDPQEFTTMLIIDVKMRLSSDQLGFKEMHPTTYLNGERWEDEYSTTAVEVNHSLMDRLTNTDWAAGLTEDKSNELQSKEG